MIIDDRKNNLESANKVGFSYKVKFIFYTLVLCITTVIFTLQCLGISGFLNKLKIINQFILFCLKFFIYLMKLSNKSNNFKEIQIIY